MEKGGLRFLMEPTFLSRHFLASLNIKSRQEVIFSSEYTEDHKIGDQNSDWSTFYESGCN